MDCLAFKTFVTSFPHADSLAHGMLCGLHLETCLRAPKDLDEHIFNGLAGVVRNVEPYGVELQTQRGPVVIWRRHDFVTQDPGTLVRRAAYDLKLGYAMTVHKAEGMTLPHVVLIFERWACRGWGYTAISRVRDRASLRIVGKPLPMHFRPRL